jgi:catechol 2,3-dioxygenase-like lactoylglutathione lyase family enzyme
MQRPDRGSANELRIGWTPSAPLASEFPDQKIALDIAASCARFIGVGAAFRSIQSIGGGADWDQLVAQLVSRKIDVIAPILVRSPHNAKQGIVFSNSIGLMLPHRLVGRADVVGWKFPESLEGEHRISEHQLLQVELINIGAGVSSTIFGRNQQNLVHSRLVSDEETALKIISEGAEGKDRVPLFVTDAPTAHRIASAHSDLAILKPPFEYDVSFPLSFAVHADEPQLLSEINMAIDGMKESGAMAGILLAKRKLLQGFLWHPEKPPETIYAPIASAGPELTHVALPVENLETSIAFYRKFCGLRVINEHGTSSKTVWMGKEHSSPILVLLSGGRKRVPDDGDLLHVGFSLSSSAEIDEIAARGKQAKCLHWEPKDLGPPVGKICALRDPNGHVIEFSFGQPIRSN